MITIVIFKIHSILHAFRDVKRQLNNKLRACRAQFIFVIWIICIVGTKVIVFINIILFPFVAIRCRTIRGRFIIVKFIGVLPHLESSSATNSSVKS